MSALSYAIKYVADMETSVQFHTVNLGLKLRFQSPGWTEFETGATTLALHLASSEHPPGSCQLGFRVANVDLFYREMTDKGIQFTAAPTPLHGQKIARFKDADGAECSVSGQ
jgi:hypothetical protein